MRKIDTTPMRAKRLTVKKLQSIQQRRKSANLWKRHHGTSGSRSHDKRPTRPSPSQSTSGRVEIHRLEVPVFAPPRRRERSGTGGTAASSPAFRLDLGATALRSSSSIPDSSTRHSNTDFWTRCPVALAELWRPASVDAGPSARLGAHVITNDHQHADTSPHQKRQIAGQRDQTGLVTFQTDGPRHQPRLHQGHQTERPAPRLQYRVLQPPPACAPERPPATAFRASGFKADSRHPRAYDEIVLLNAVAGG